MGGSLTCTLRLALSCPGRALSTLGLWTCPLPLPKAPHKAITYYKPVFPIVHTRNNIQTAQQRRIPFRNEILFYCFSYQVYSARYLGWLLSMCSFSKLGFAQLVLSACEEPLLLHISQEFSSKMHTGFMYLCFKQFTHWPFWTSPVFALKLQCFGLFFEFKSLLSKCHLGLGWQHLWSCTLQNSFGGDSATYCGTSFEGAETEVQILQFMVLSYEKKISLWNLDRSHRPKGEFNSGITKNVHQKDVRPKCSGCPSTPQLC